MVEAGTIPIVVTLLGRAVVVSCDVELLLESVVVETLPTIALVVVLGSAVCVTTEVTAATVPL